MLVLQLLRPKLSCSAVLSRPLLTASLSTAVLRSALRSRIAPLTALTAHNVQLRQTFNPPLQQQRRQPYSFLLSHNSRPGVRSRQQRTVSVASSALEQQQEQEQGLQTEATEVEALAAVMGQQPDGEGAETVAKRLRQEGGGAQPQPQALQQQQQQQQPKRKKARVLSPEMLARQAIHQAAKENDLQGALAVFDRAKAEGVRLSADLYISLLYLCSGGDAWEQRLSSSSSLPPSLASAAAGSAHAAAVGAAAGQQQQQQEEQQQEQLGEAVADDADAVEQAAVPSPQLQQQLDAAVVLQRAQGIFDEMTTSGVGEGAASAAAAAGASAAADGSGGGGKRLQRLAPTEMCFTALARLYACSGDADRAFQLAKDCLDAGIAPKLRTFTPALIAYAEQGDCDRAFEVDALIAEQQLDLTEPEFARLLQASAAGAAAGGGAAASCWERGVGVLRRVGAELTVLQPDTLQRVRQLFAAAPAAPDGGAAAAWAVESTTVSASGVCGTCGGQLRALDLTDAELAQFAEGIAAIAERQERRPNDFQQFKAWLAQHGPYGAVVDGANVALYAQNFETGGFNFSQIQSVVDHLASRHPELKPLVMLHVGRTKAPQARLPASQKLLQELTDAHCFYTTPAGSNDDWYWIYASVMAGERGLLVSNDEMRDHLFQLLAPKYFLKWKQRHQLKYHFGPAGLQVDYPAPYTTCVQQLDCGAWVFPGADGTWLCARQQPQQPAA